MKFAPVTARGSNWGQSDGTQKPIVRISGGRNTVAVEYDDLPRLIAELAMLMHERGTGVNSWPTGPPTADAQPHDDGTARPTE